MFNMGSQTTIVKSVVELTVSITYFAKVGVWVQTFMAWYDDPPILPILFTWLTLQVIVHVFYLASKSIHILKEIT